MTVSQMPLTMVDKGRIAMRPVVELSFLTAEEQYYLLDAMEQYDCMPSHAQAIRMKNLSRESVLYRHMIGKIMEETSRTRMPRSIWIGRSSAASSHPTTQMTR